MADRDILVVTLKKMISEGRYNDGEDTLFQFAENEGSIDISDIGQWFYNQLSVKSDDKLLEKNFSRNEISQGLKDFMNIVHKKQ